MIEIILKVYLLSVCLVLLLTMIDFE